MLVTDDIPRIWWENRENWRKTVAGFAYAYDINFKSSEGCVCATRHSTSKVYQHTNELTLICDKCFLHIGSAVSCHTHTHTFLWWFIKISVSTDYKNPELLDNIFFFDDTRFTLVSILPEFFMVGCVTFIRKSTSRFDFITQSIL